MFQMNVKTSSKRTLIMYLSLQLFSVSGAAKEPTEAYSGFRSILFVDNQHGWMSGSRGSYFTKNGGRSWKRLKGNIGKTLDNMQSWGDPLFNQPGRIVWADKSEAVIRGERNLYLCRTSDGTLSAITDQNGIYGRLGRISFSDGIHGWGVGSKGTIFFTDNGGREWRETGHESLGVIEDLMAISDGGLWAVSISGNVFHTIDGGKNWRQIQLETPENRPSLRTTRIRFLNRQIGWVENLTGSVFKTVDGGDNWRKAMTPGEYCDILTGVSFSSELDGWAIGVRSPSPEVSEVCFDAETKERTQCPEFKDNAVMQKKSVGMFVLHTGNDGNTWEIKKADIADYLTDIQALAGGVVWVVGRKGTVLNTRDNGTNWETVAIH
jgi:photosystem II stability/assembly factor-like uncharacterized protein